MPGEFETDIVVLGGGVAGLWTLATLRNAGWNVVLFEASALGQGQTLHSQGIIHGGGKYALRRVRDLAAVQAIREMPGRWRRHLSGEEAPDLSGVTVLSNSCLLWDSPSTGLLSGLRRLMLPAVVTSGLLSTPPRRLKDVTEWPEVLRGAAGSVYAMAEPVLATRSLMTELARPHRDVIFSGELADDIGLEPRSGESRWRLRMCARAAQGAHLEQSVSARAVILTAGAGNEELAARFAARTSGEPGDGRSPEEPTLMQRRPLSMVLLRGELPPLYAHWIRGGRTRLTITAGDTTAASAPTADAPAAPGVWAIGGMVAEAAELEDAELRAAAVRELRTALPHLELGGMAMATYRAVRAEASTPGAQRPSGVHFGWVAPQVLAAWPTKLSLAPVLADGIHAELQRELGDPASRSSPSTGVAAAATPTAGQTVAESPTVPAAWPRPEPGRYPWEDATWHPTT